jgi:membrane-associated phospholipid phosphatase
MAGGMNMATSVTTTQGWSLPLFLTRETKYLYGWTMFGFAALIYALANHLFLFPPKLLPMYWVDRMTPFMPNSIWIYLSEYAFFTTIYMVSRDMVNLNKFLYSFLILQVTSVTIFWLWPTTYPRDLFPLPQDLNAWSYYAFSSLRGADNPASCCPSLHVSSVFLCAFIYLDEQREKFPFFIIWAAAIAVSTLTTKQHYLIDVVAGLLMAALHYWFFHKMVNYRDVRRALHAKR